MEYSTFKERKQYWMDRKKKREENEDLPAASLCCLGLEEIPKAQICIFSLPWRSHPRTGRALLFLWNLSLPGMVFPDL